MLNLLEDYRFISLPESGDFTTNPNLRKKADNAGKLLPYFGNTTVFLLDDGTREKLKALQQRLHEAVGEMLSEPLAPETFHMTLHDLVNADRWTEELAAQVERTEEEAKGMIRQWRRFPNLKMRGTWMFNMVSTSIVLGLEPADEESYHQLDWMYGQLEEIVPLGYALTPHITLAYFCPGTYSQKQLDRLRGVLGPVSLEMELKMENLVYQTFRDMNHYLTCE